MLFVTVYKMFKSPLLILYLNQLCFLLTFCLYFPTPSLDEYCLHACKNLGRYCIPWSKVEKIRSRVLAWDIPHCPHCCATAHQINLFYLANERYSFYSRCFSKPLFIFFPPYLGYLEKCGYMLNVFSVGL